MVQLYSWYSRYYRRQKAHFPEGWDSIALVQVVVVVEILWSRFAVIGIQPILRPIIISIFINNYGATYGWDDSYLAKDLGATGSLACSSPAPMRLRTLLIEECPHWVVGPFAATLLQCNSRKT